MIRKIDSLATAQAIIDLLICGDEITRLEKDWFIESYQNGREQGFTITDIVGISYYICEGRRTDSICIYKGKCSMQSISDDAYSHPNYFGRDFDKAVRWLLDELKSFEN